MRAFITGLLLVALLLLPASASAECAPGQQDTQAPQKPSVTNVYAISYSQLWVEWSHVHDLGCTGDVSYIVEAVNVATGQTNGIPGAPDVNAVRNGSAHEALIWYLDPATTYRVQVKATDDVNTSAPGASQSRTTASDLRTVLAGQAKHGTDVIPGLEVGTPAERSITDAGGWYRLRLDTQQQTTFDVTYRGCELGYQYLPLAYCATGWAADTDQVTVTTGFLGGKILPRHKTMGVAP